MSAGAGFHTLGHVPRAHRGRVVAARFTRAQALAGLALLALDLEPAIGLVGGRLAADGQAAAFARAATAVAILAHVVEAAQLAAFVRGVVATDVAALAAAVIAQVHGRLGRAALADHRQQGQRGRHAVLQSH